MEINTKSRQELESYFLKGARPTQDQFAELVGAGLNQKDFGVTRPPSSPLSIVTEGSAEEALHFYPPDANDGPTWKLAMNPNNGAGAEGFDFATGEGQSRLFLQADGAIGLGTTTPEESLHMRVSSGKGARFLFENLSGAAELTLRTGEAGDDKAFGWRVEAEKGAAATCRLTNHQTGKDCLKIDDQGRFSVGGYEAFDFFHVKKDDPGAVRVRVENRGGDASFRMTGKSSDYEWAANGAADRLALRRNGSEDLLAVDANGRLGIGVSAPAEMLHLKKSSGRIRLQLQSGNDNVMVKFTAGSKSNFCWAADSSKSRMNLYNYKSDSNNKKGDLVSIDGKGRMGIGVAAPADYLHVKTTGSTKARIRVESESDNAIFRAKSKNSDFGWYAAGSENRMSLWNYASDSDSNKNGHLMTINGRGRVGIGASGPSTLLHLIGNSKTGGSIRLNHSVSGEVVSLQMRTYNGNHSQFSVGVTGGENGRFYVWDGKASSSKYRLNLLKNGNFGIGTSEPKKKLSVVGAIRAAKETAESNNVEISHDGNNGILRRNGKGVLRVYPGARLDVNGLVRASADVAKSNSVEIGYSGGSGFLRRNGSGNLSIYVGNTRAIDISSNGDVSASRLKWKWEISSEVEVKGASGSSYTSKNIGDHTTPQSIAFITYINGDFNGSEEVGKVYTSGSQWKVAARGASKRNITVKARAARLVFQ